ncbi:MAG TPA: prolipoprotein diacylglyceryl transferase family protein [Bryobacteraceae bacterium]|nr:prolipoprotein diacylglyceryl transferase family protein [Bryobacteraceae bacterium]
MIIPYSPEPVLHFGPVGIGAFRFTLVGAVLLGGWIMIRRACRFKMSGHLMFSVSRWAIACGLIGADVAKMAMDYTSLFLADPAVIFTTSRGIRSIGGLAGGLIGALICFKLRRVPWTDRFRMLDIMAFAMPFAFAVGRLGCFLVHDHRGLASTSWIAVQFPEGPRYDLGLIECLFLIPVSALFVVLDRKPRRAGFFLGLYGIIYGGFRIWLDTLHLQPMRFYEGSALVLMGIAALIAMSHYPVSMQQMASVDSPRTVPLPVNG